MKMLLIHTCGVEGSVAVADTEGVPVVVGTVMLAARTFSEGLVPAVGRVLAAAGWGMADVEAVAVVSGPGSFTGVRTGMSVGKGLCEGRGIPLVAVSRLALLAGKRGATAVLDAGRGEFYVGTSGGGERLMGIEELRRVIGAGRAVVCEEKVAGVLGGMVEVVGEPMAGDAVEMAMAALGRGGNDVLGDANYVRRTDAEIFARPVG